MHVTVFPHNEYERLKIIDAGVFVFIIQKFDPHAYLEQLLTKSRTL